MMRKIISWLLLYLIFIFCYNTILINIETNKEKLEKIQKIEERQNGIYDKKYERMDRIREREDIQERQDRGRPENHDRGEHGGKGKGKGHDK